MIFAWHPRARAGGASGGADGAESRDSTGAASGAHLGAEADVPARRPRWQRRRLLTGALIGCYVLATLALLPVATRQGPVLPGIIPLFVGGVLTTELATSFLLFASFRQGRSLSLLLLGCAYLYSGLMSLPHLMTFPGALLADGPIIGSPQSTAYIFILWILGYAALASLAVFCHLRFRNQPLSARQTGPAIAIGAALVVGVVGLFSLGAIAFAHALPSLIEGSRWT